MADFSWVKTLEEAQKADMDNLNESLLARGAAEDQLEEEFNQLIAHVWNTFEHRENVLRWLYLRVDSGSELESKVLAELVDKGAV